ncbi:MAG: type II toxin-antitoxin system VapC family toxin [Acidobacteriota bacterium]|nr:type II toxin-antitoxin system VapC family toxin [Acidobacteriota bacterium]
MSFVLDCSVTVAWLFEDEATPAIDALQDQLKEEVALVPGHWRLEVGNVLAQAERRKRLTPAQTSAHLELLDRLPVATDNETDSRAFREILSVARTERLTTHDAAYLELAARRGVPLATLDRALARAARRVGVATLPA